MRGLWAKLNLTDQREIAVLNAPDSFAAQLGALGRSPWVFRERSFSLCITRL